MIFYTSGIPVKRVLLHREVSGAIRSTPKNGNSGREIKWNWNFDKKSSKIVVYLSRLSSFSWNSNRMVSAHRVERFCADKHGVGLSAELPNSTQNGVGNCGVVDVLRVYISFRRRNMSGVGSHGMPVILATAGYDHTIRFWQAHSGICHRTVQHPDSISFPCLLFSFR